jgi:hypothetical protein
LVIVSFLLFFLSQFGSSFLLTAALFLKSR